MEILLIVLAFLFGTFVGAVLAAGYIRYRLIKQAQQMEQQVLAMNGGDPMAMLEGLFDQLSEAKKNA